MRSLGLVLKISKIAEKSRLKPVYVLFEYYLNHSEIKKNDKNPGKKQLQKKLLDKITPHCIFK